MSTLAAMSKRNWKPEAVIITLLGSKKMCMEFCFNTFNTFDTACKYPIEDWQTEFIETARGDIKHYRTVKAALRDLNNYVKKVEISLPEIIFQISAGVEL